MTFQEPRHDFKVNNGLSRIEKHYLMSSYYSLLLGIAPFAVRRVMNINYIYGMVMHYFQRIEVSGFLAVKSERSVTY